MLLRSLRIGECTMNERSSMRSLNPRRNEAVERKKLFEEMLLKEMPGNAK